MKKVLLSIIILILIGGGVYYFGLYQQKDRNVDVWSLPPSGAVWVYESNQTVNSWNRLISYDYWKNLSTLPFLGSMKAQFEKLDSLTGKGGNIDKMLRNNPFLISCHLTSKNEFGYVFYFKIPDAKQHIVIKDILSHYEDRESYQTNVRTFAGYKINELSKKGSGEIFSYLMVNDHFIGSFEPFLIEDVIRNLDSKLKNNFFKKHAAFSSINKVHTDDGNIYFDAGQLVQFLSVFTGRDNQTIQNLSQFATSLYLDAETEKDYILFNGSSHAPEDLGSYYLNTFKDQKAQSFNLSPLVPARASALLKYSFTDPVKWQRDLTAFWQANNTKYYNDRTKFEVENELSAPIFNSWLGAGIGYAIIESVNPDDPDKLIYLHAKDLAEGLNRFNRLAELSAERKGDTVYVETFGERTIGMVDLNDVPKMVFGPQFTGFQQCYFTTYGNYIILGNRIAVLKSLFADIESESVWGKSVKHTRFLENTLPQSNISLIINTERAWNSLMHQMNSDWKPIFQKHAAQLKKFEFLAVQFNQVDNRFYTGIIAQINHESTPEMARQQFAVKQQVQTEAPIITKPFIVRNHNDKSFEVLLQDSLNQIYLISKDGHILWKLGMQKPILGNVYQIDFLRNGKLQYLYADESSIKLIDRNGNFVTGFPMHFPDSIKIKTLSVIDYDNSRRYRMLISDTKGRLYMYNMEKENLAGWTPLALNGQVAFPPEHIRVRGRDCMIAVEKSGMVHILSRRGEYFDGFPLNLNTEMVSPMFFESGSSFNDAKFNAINQNGVILQFNLFGKTVSSTQLYKPSKETIFRICSDAMQQTYVIARQDYNRLSILDQKGDQLFEKDYVTSGDLSVQYYHFSMDNKIFAVTDKVQEFTYIYNTTGELINFQPIESGFEIGLLYSDAQKSYQIYSCFGNKFTVSTFYKE